MSAEIFFMLLFLLALWLDVTMYVRRRRHPQQVLYVPGGWQDEFLSTVNRAIGEAVQAGRTPNEEEIFQALNPLLAKMVAEHGAKKVREMLEQEYKRTGFDGFLRVKLKVPE